MIAREQRLLANCVIAREYRARVSGSVPMHKWFVWHTTIHPLMVGFVHRSPRPWIVASHKAPRWA